MDIDNNHFNDLELELLRQSLKHLRPQASELLVGQLNTINLIQRHSDAREVCCYSMKGGKVARDPAMQFPATDLEIKFMTIHFECMHMHGSWTASFILVQGYFFSIVFNPSPARIQDCEMVLINRVDVHRDPMLAEHRSCIRSGESPLSQPLGWLDPPLVQGWASEALDRAQREVLLRRIDAVLPPDYIELVEQCDEGLSAGEWQILGLSEVYEITLPDGDYYALAELVGKGMLLVGAGGRDGRMSFAAYSGGNPVAVESSLQTLITSQGLG